MTGAVSTAMPQREARGQRMGESGAKRIRSASTLSAEVSAEGYGSIEAVRINGKAGPAPLLLPRGGEENFRHL